MINTQISNILNTVLPQVIGESATLVTEDLSNIVEVGTQVIGSQGVLDEVLANKYVKGLIDQVGKLVVVDRTWKGSAPNIIKDDYEYGSVMEKISIDFDFDFVDNLDWKELESGTNYSDNIYYGSPNIEVKLYNKETSFRLQVSIKENVLKSSFRGPEQMNAFLSAIFTQIETKLTIALDKLIMMTISALMAETLHSEYQDENYSAKSGRRAVNLLKLYKDTVKGADQDLTKDNCIYDKEFLRFACTTLDFDAKKLNTPNKIFNIGGKVRFTPKERLHVIMLAQIDSILPKYLFGDTYHDTVFSLPKYETVLNWQGIGDDTNAFDFDVASGIHVNLDSDEVVASGIIAVMFDEEACGVRKFNKNTRSNYVNSADFLNYWYNVNTAYYIDTNEQCTVYFVA